MNQLNALSNRVEYRAFRHNFKDALQNAKVTEAISRALMGHADDSVHAQYGSGPSVALLKEEIDKVVYPIQLAAG